MLPQQAVDHYGSRQALATRCGVTPTSIWLWLKQGWIPYDKQTFLEHDSQGVLKADWMDLPTEKRPLHLQTAA